MLAGDTANVWEDVELRIDPDPFCTSCQLSSINKKACLFHKGFCTVYFGAEKKNAVTLPHSALRKHAFLGKIKNMSKKNKLPARKKSALELLHQRIGHRSTISLLAGDTANVWEYVELRIYPSATLLRSESC